MRAFRTFLFAIFAGSAFPVPAADTAGVFTQVDGEVKLLRGDNYLEAEQGVEVGSQDIIETEADAAAQLDMEDGSVLKLGPNSRLALSEYRLDSNKSILSAGIDLLSGWLRFAVAKLKPQGKYSIHTPVLTIGVRGTEGTIEAESEQGGLYLDRGEVEVAAADPEGVAEFAPVRVRSGEYIHRLRGRTFDKLPRPPPAFVHRLPPVVQHKLARRALDPRLRGISPRVIRAVTKDDAQRFLQRHPRLNERLQQRFTPPVKPEAGVGGKVRHEPAAPNGIPRAPAGLDERGRREAVRMAPVTREMPHRQGGGVWMRRVPPAMGRAPLQNVPAFGNTPPDSQERNAPSGELRRPKNEPRGDMIRHDDATVPRHQTMPRVMREHLAPHRAPHKEMHNAPGKYGK